MDRSALAQRRHKQETAQQGRPPIRLRHHHRTQSDSTSTPTPTQPQSPNSPITSRIRRHADDSYFPAHPDKGHQRNDTQPTVGKSSLASDDNPKHFTVVNVGAGGVLYLKPSRGPGHAQHHYAPATPSVTSDVAGSSAYSQNVDERPLLRGSDASLYTASLYSGIRTPRMTMLRSRTAGDLKPTSTSGPPISIHNPHNRRTLTRSLSLSTISDPNRSSRYDANEFHLPINDRERPRKRRRSSADTDRGELGVQIPHWRLGTPKFSDRGTAYLHSSIYTNSTITVPSSVLEKQEYDKLFPVPPGRGISFVARQSNGHLSSLLLPENRTQSIVEPAPSNRPSTVGFITPSTFDKIESNLDNPIFVHYNPSSGRIVAATPARLIAQITSPEFLDYELLADFFLTFRCFMQCEELLDYLFARLKWALTSGNDSGRIVRVRTFVALRHWILNYFADDFMMDAPFRQNFCSYVNELTYILRRRPDGGAGDMNIVSELKKCWRRTCALYWPVHDALSSSPDADIHPGGISRLNAPTAGSELSLPLSIRPTTYRGSIFEMMTIQLPDQPEPPHVAMIKTSAGPRSTIGSNRTASLPASPLSDTSLEVLSCSVPFLRNIRPSARQRERAQKPGPRIAGAPPKTSKNRPALRHHKRSGSFTDALRDKRAPLAAPQATENIELKQMTPFAVTGGLVRGLLLQPSPSAVDNTVPVTPGPELVESRFPGSDTDGESKQDRNIGVRRFVGEVRRALNHRKGSSSRSPTRSVSSKGSKGSKTSRDGTDKPRVEKRRSPDWQQLPGPARTDILGRLIEKSYQTAWEASPRSEFEPIQEKPSQVDLLEQDEEGETPRPVTAHQHSSVPAPPPIPSSHDTSFEPRDFGRDTHVTNGSRSIVIVDATGAPELPMMSGALPSLRPSHPDMIPIPLFQNRTDWDLMPSPSSKYSYPEPPRTMSGEPQYHWRSSDANIHDLLTSQRRSTIHSGRREYSQLPPDGGRGRLSSPSRMDPGLIELPQQLRRVPGGNLRDVNHVRSLEMNHPRPRSEGSILSLLSRTTASQFPPARVQATASQRSTQDGGVLLPQFSLEDLKKSSVVLLETHSSQPVLRPSFEEEARKLKGIPDYEYEGGGAIEDALLKLEGKAPSPSSSTFSGSSTSGISRTSMADPMADTKMTTFNSGEESPLPHPPKLTQMPTGDVRPMYGDIPMKISPSIQSSQANAGGSPTTEVQGASIYHQSVSTDGFPLPIFPEPRSSDTIRRHDNDIETASSATNSVVPMAARVGYGPVCDPYTAASTPESFAFVHSPNSINSGSMPFRYPSTASGAIPSFKPWDTRPSFLVDDDHSFSDISTEIAEYEDENGNTIRSFYFEETPVSEGYIRPFQPVYATPPSTATGMQESPDRRLLLPRAVPSQPGQKLKQQISNPKPQDQAANQPFRKRPTEQLLRAHTSPSSPSERMDMPSFDRHIPFVLGFESEVIAEQLTIIEKDALDEVDWKDLISLNWQQSPAPIRNWVEYLNNETSNGIDIVIARFNLVVKWCISEIILTEAPTERARAITKYIHIAAHCHRMRNYASLYQITLALLSNEISRLHMTWSLVALREKHMLEQLEQLCRPLRNFHNLRAEMETSLPELGVIPFIGLYTHDLMFNALKSARIDPPAPGREPLVNFERYQTAASIVKNLLRLIEASSKYTFNPAPEALSRCLWIAALEDSEIQARSLALEKD